MTMMMNRLSVATVLLFLFLAHDRPHGVTQAFTIPSSTTTTTTTRTVTKTRTTATKHYPTTTLHPSVSSTSSRSSSSSSSSTTQLCATLDVMGHVTQSLFAWQGPVPLVLAAAVNAVGFATLSAKLATMLTPAGLAHAFALGTGLWATLGWRGWTYCVLYFFWGQAVTKLRFQEKEVSPKQGEKAKETKRNNMYFVSQGSFVGVCCVCGCVRD